MSEENAQELKLLLEKIHKQALADGDLNLRQRFDEYIDGTLKGFLSGRINLERISVS